jgi:hypothetical protein
MTATVAQILVRGWQLWPPCHGQKVHGRVEDLVHALGEGREPKAKSWTTATTEPFIAMRRRRKRGEGFGRAAHGGERGLATVCAWGVWYGVGCIRGWLLGRPEVNNTLIDLFKYFQMDLN